MSLTRATSGADAPLEGAGAAEEPSETTLRRILRSPVIVTFGALVTICVVFTIQAPGASSTRRATSASSPRTSRS